MALAVFGCGKGENNVDVSCQLSLENSAQFCPDNTRPSAVVVECRPNDDQCVTTNLKGCYVNCVPAKCGDGVTDQGEQCDLGEENGTGRGCSNTCRTDTTAPCEQGMKRCGTSAGAEVVERCFDGIWEAYEDCTSDELCDDQDPAKVRCSLVDDFCPTSGLKRCVGPLSRQTCGPGNRWLPEPCPVSAPQCVEAVGTASCVPGEDYAASANFRMSRSSVIVGGLVGYSSNSANTIELGPASKWGDR